MIDFKDLFIARGLSPAPDRELAGLLQDASTFMSVDDIFRFIDRVKRFDKQPMSVSDSFPGEFLIDLSYSEIVHWWYLRESLKVLPCFFGAAGDIGLTYDSAVDLVLALADAKEYDSDGIEDMLKRMTDILQTVREAEGSIDPETVKRFLVVGRTDGEIDRAIGNVQNCVNAGMRLQQAMDFVTRIIEGPGIVGYALMGVYDHLDALAANNVDADLMDETLNVVLDAGMQFGNFVDLIHHAATSTELSQSEIFERFNATVRGLTGEQKLLPTATVGAALLPAPGSDRAFKARDDYFPEIHARKLVNGILPYRMERSFEDGLADLRELMKETHTEGAWVFDQASTTWYSFGGKTESSVDKVRHEFMVYDIAALSDHPVLVHIHPKRTETYVVPDRGSLELPMLQKRITSFNVAMPSGADFGLIADLQARASKKVSIVGLIVTSEGITEFEAPGDPEAAATVADTFKLLKGEVMSKMDPRAFVGEFGIRGSNLPFIDSLRMEVMRKLPDGFRISIRSHEAYLRDHQKYLQLEF